MKTKVIPLLATIALLAQLIVVALPVNAASKTIVVPDDYSTIADAIANANNGDTILVKKGTYEEQTLEIKKALSIIGEDVSSTILNLHPPVYNITKFLMYSFANLSNAISVAANNFLMANLTVNLSPDGYISVTGNDARIINNYLGGGSQSGIIIDGSYSNITDNKFGGFISSAGDANGITRNMAYSIKTTGYSNTVYNNTVWSLSISNASQSTFNNNRIGSAFTYYDGLSELARENSGIIIDGNSSFNNIFDNDIAAYIFDVDIRSNISENNLFYHNNFANNSKYYGISIRTSESINFWDNGVQGNYWEDYKGKDSNGDGVGDTPYVLDSNNIDHYPLMQPWTGSLPAPNSGRNQILIVAIAVVFLGAVLVVLVFFLKRRNSGFQLGSKSVA
jgi:nitrous oxidase accessory protein